METFNTIPMFLDMLFSKWIMILMFFIMIGSFGFLSEPGRFGRTAYYGFILTFVYWMSLLTFLASRS